MQKLTSSLVRSAVSALCKHCDVGATFPALSVFQISEYLATNPRVLQTSETKALLTGHSESDACQGPDEAFHEARLHFPSCPWSSASAIWAKAGRTTFSPAVLAAAALCNLLSLFISLAKAEQLALSRANSGAWKSALACLVTLALRCSWLSPSKGGLDWSLLSRKMIHPFVFFGPLDGPALTWSWSCNSPSGCVASLMLRRARLLNRAHGAISPLFNFDFFFFFTLVCCFRADLGRGGFAKSCKFQLCEVVLCCHRAWVLGLVLHVCSACGGPCEVRLNFYVATFGQPQEGKTIFEMTCSTALCALLLKQGCEARVTATGPQSQHDVVDLLLLLFCGGRVDCPQKLPRVPVIHKHLISPKVSLNPDASLEELGSGSGNVNTRNSWGLLGPKPSQFFKKFNWLEVCV